MVGRVASLVAGGVRAVARTGSTVVKYGYKGLGRTARAGRRGAQLAALVTLIGGAYSAYVGYEGARDRIEERVCAPLAEGRERLVRTNEAAGRFVDREVERAEDNPVQALVTLLSLVSLLLWVRYRTPRPAAPAAAGATVDPVAEVLATANLRATANQLIHDQEVNTGRLKELPAEFTRAENELARASALAEAARAEAARLEAQAEAKRKVLRAVERELAVREAEHDRIEAAMSAIEHQL